MRVSQRSFRPVRATGAACCAAPPAPALSLGVWARAGLPALAVAIAVYVFLEPLANLFTTRVLGLSLQSRLGSAAAFFVFEAPKVLLLLAAVTFLVGFLQSWLDPVRTRELLARRSGPLGNLLASLFGIITPFCSCSAVPLFIGLMRVGVPLGVTFSYLVAAPMINEVALVLLLAMFGLRIAAFYALTGLSVAVLAGLVMGRLRMEAYVEPWVLSEAQAAPRARAAAPTLARRLDLALASARDIVGKVWPYLLAGLAVGAFIHGYVPEGLLARFMGKDAWWTVPVAVVIGVPLYASTAVILPIVQTLLAKGAALGTVLAFMMAVTALSLPETIILRKVLKVRLIVVFLAVVTLGILAVGYLFNYLI